MKNIDVSNKYYDLVVIGGGSGGLASAISAYDSGVKDILVIEKDEYLGGILNQCIHNGFGLHEFKEELAGPEYAQRFIDELESRNIDFKLNTVVFNINNNNIYCVQRIAERNVRNAAEGMWIIKEARCVPSRLVAAFLLGIYHAEAFYVLNTLPEILERLVDLRALRVILL